MGFSTRNDHDHGCVPLEVGFEDGLTAGSGAISDWLWNFAMEDIYRIEVVCGNNQVIPLQGNITLIR